MVNALCTRCYSCARNDMWKTRLFLGLTGLKKVYDIACGKSYKVDLQFGKTISGNVPITFSPAPFTYRHRETSDFFNVAALPAQYVNCSTCYERRWFWYVTAQYKLTPYANSTVEDIPEADFYRYTRHRWVYVYGNPFTDLVCWSISYNEACNLSQRYLKFNLQELVRIAVEAASKGGAHRCKQSQAYITWYCY